MASSLFSLLSVAACIVVVCTAFSVPKLNNNHYRGLENTIQRRVNSFVSTTTTSRRSSFTSSISSNEDLLPGIFVIDDANDIIIDKIENLQESSYFRLFCVDILASCEYMPQELFECYAETCEVYPVDDDAVSYYGTNISEYDKHVMIIYRKPNILIILAYDFVLFPPPPLPRRFFVSDDV